MVISCQVFTVIDGVLIHCPEPAVARCSAGFRFCKTHKKGHGDPPHRFKAILKKERERDNG